MVIEIYISDFTNNHLPVPYWFPVIVVSFFGWIHTSVQRGKIILYYMDANSKKSR